MSEVFYDLPSKAALGQGAWHATIASNPNDLSEKVMVIIPDFDPQLQWGPCRWQSRDDVSLPNRGDPCLVILDNDREPWVVCWWPFLT